MGHVTYLSEVTVSDTLGNIPSQSGSLLSAGQQVWPAQ